MRVAMTSVCCALSLGLFSAVAGEGIDTSSWVTLNAGNAFTLRAPAGTAYTSMQGIDSFVAGFDNPQFHIEFDYGPYSNTLADFGADPDYKVEDFDIDGRKARLITGPGKNAWGCNDLVTAAYVVVSHRGGQWGDTRLEISGCTKTMPSLETLHEIFRSIRFNPR